MIPCQKILTRNQLRILAYARKIAFMMGRRVYLVGGTVRDMLLSRPDVDLDLTVEGDGLFFARELARQLGARVVFHERLLTATIYWGGERVDVATCRQEHYPEPGAMPEVKPANLMLDLGRRDFSVNAMALPLIHSDLDDIIDPYNGRVDLANGLLRVLHRSSFSDDPSRILRGVRLATRLKFELEAETGTLARQALAEGRLDALDSRRFWREFVLLLREQRTVAAWQKLLELGWQGFPGCGPPDVSAGLRAEKLLYQWQWMGRRRMDSLLVYFLVATAKLSATDLEGVLESLNWGRKRRRVIYKSRALWKDLAPVLPRQVLPGHLPGGPRLVPEAVIFILAMSGKSQLPAWVLT